MAPENVSSIDSSTFSIVAFENAITRICVELMTLSTGSWLVMVHLALWACHQGDWESSETYVDKIEQLIADGGQSQSSIVFRIS